ncbi:GNAT family N-acetyltransferase [Kineosporia succinea]|uniref:GNAT family acetyltransferase n=1 Tax=Kineosporia succinea TaxID=84632 RepID=A0ABT9PEG4_9ACTN|nr:GNAT family N-acetyltransferase [Kineosporia succinea]MDP9831094.1 putative GNAT family acetyltransferase [Kineosporia succinea]
MSDVTHLLDNPSWASLTGAHAALAIGTGRARRYPADISPISAIADYDDPAAWADLAELVGPGRSAFFPGPADLAERLPDGWTISMSIPGIQMVSTQALVSAPEPEAVRLGADDVDDMLDLVARTEPGPFERRTVELGTYLGIRREGKLVAMAGERLHPPGHTEISAVCTDAAHRGQGLAGRLIRAVAHAIRERGDVPMLHTGASNTTAIRLYEYLGFEVRWRPTFTVVVAPPA